ncbi:hypothetical protein JQN64_27850 [Escherichia coli]|nr:hypothetical protein [Escherichia coli]
MATLKRQSWKRPTHSPSTLGSGQPRVWGEGMKKGERRRNRKIRRKENSKKEKIIREKKRKIKFE